MPSYRLAAMATAFLLVTNDLVESSMSFASKVSNLRFFSTSFAISSPDFPAPKRKAQPSYFEPAVQGGLQKLMLLGARVEGKVFDQEGTKWEDMKPPFGALLVWAPSWFIHMILVGIYCSGENAPRPGERMPPFILPDETGRLVSLESLLQNGPVAVMFYRVSDHVRIKHYEVNK